MDFRYTRQSAKSLVEKIAKDHGHPGGEKLQKIEPELRREINESFLTKDLLSRSKIIKLAQNLYTSKARFIFELLQNADNNTYDNAKATGAIPYISFRVYPCRIVIECNEDGFSYGDLKAISSAGQSSRHRAQAYIGKDNIGFKSVFLAAWKAHIQSGVFSFSFTHKPGDSGMGMISPIWEDDAEEVRESPLTRITLHLHVTGDKEIEEQFKDLQETSLLFMKNLRKISVAFYNAEEEQTLSTTYLIKRPRSHYAILERTRIANNQQETEIKHFHVTVHEVTSHDKNEARNLSKLEEVTHAYSKSEVILAFPLSDTSVPITKPQDLFTFIPVRQVGFKFLIQADFIIDATQQDIAEDSPRNHDLLDSIADAYIKAVLQFCEHDTLRYRWMRYLPDKETSRALGPFWASLVNKIAVRLSTTPVLFGRGRSDRCLINDLFRLNDDDLDENGEPLFDIGEPGQLISQCYDKEDLEVLSNYGLRFASYQEIREWLRDDLRRGLQSRMKSPGTSKSWHIRAAKLIQHHFISQSLSERINELKKMDILPLGHNSWIAASQGPVYFPQVNGLDIPPDIDLPVISKQAVSSSQHATFVALGIRTAPISLVREKILQKYPYDVDSSFLALSASKRHLEFLYLSHHLEGIGKYSYSGLSIIDDEMNLVKPSFETVYIADEEPFGPSELLRKTGPGSKPGDNAPGLKASFVHKEYFRNSPSTPRFQHMTWTEWLYNHLGVQKLVLVGSDTLSLHGQYVQKYRPEKFLGWIYLKNQRDKNLSQDLVNCLRETKVLCRGNRQCLLRNTYFPTKELQRRVERYVGHGAFFPWLWLDMEEAPNAIPSGWKSFLTQLKIACPPTDLDFALGMLNYSLAAFPEKISDASRVKLFELYDHIQTKYIGEDDQVAERKKIRNAFSENACLYVPLTGNRFGWVFLKECVWDAPQKLESKHTLKHLYNLWEFRDGSFAHLENFFTTTLGVVEGTWETYVHELKALRDLGCENIDTVSGIYTALHALRPQILGTSKVKFKEAFEDDALIYLPSDEGRAWHKASQCVWSNTVRPRGKVSINDEYEDMEELFVELMAVQLGDLAMAIGELKKAGKKQSPSEQEVKESIWMVNSLLSKASRSPSPDSIGNSRIFPIRHPDGSVTLGPKTTEFFIVDREPLRRAFETKVKFLNFTLEEVVRLRPFFVWTGLGTRFLSQCVKEITSFYGAAIRALNPKCQIRNRARALLRIAAHFNSPRLQQKSTSDPFYQVLKNAGVFKTYGVSSDLSLSQDGVAHKVAGKGTTLHIDEDNLCLQIYLPFDIDDHEYTFTKVLPQRLFEWMMTDPVTNISGAISKDGIMATSDVMLAPHSRIARALEDNGIAALDMINIVKETLPELDSPTTPVRTSERGYETTSPSSRGDSDSENFGTPVRTSEGGSETTSPSSRGDSDSENFGTPASSIMSIPIRTRHKQSRVEALGQNHQDDTDIGDNGFLDRDGHGYV